MRYETAKIEGEKKKKKKKKKKKSWSTLWHHFCNGKEDINFIFVYFIAITIKIKVAIFITLIIMALVGENYKNKQ